MKVLTKQALSFIIRKEFCAGIAQLAEQLICNQQVVGSIPIASSNEKPPGNFVSGLFLFSRRGNFSGFGCNVVAIFWQDIIYYTIEKSLTWSKAAKDARADTLTGLIRKRAYGKIIDCK